MTLELRLLLACARILPGPEDEAAIRQMLADGTDWTLFTRKAIDHGLAGLAGHVLASVAPDMVPDDILGAFRLNVEQIRKSNTVLFDELAGMMEALANNGVEAIPFKGPVIAVQAYGDLGLRVFRDLDFLIRDTDMPPTMATLRGLGYERKGELTEAQIDTIRRLQGQDILFKKSGGIAVEPHTRLTPLRMALDIDYAGLWRRAQRTALNGRTMLTLSPEDHLLILAIHGGKELWWRIGWACDIAVLVASHPKLDWNAILERARAQGCLRMVLLAASLARRYFAAVLPDAVVAAELADPVIEPMVERVMARWQADQPGGPPSNSRLSMDRLRLHDGVVRRVRYAVRTWSLPGPHHVAWIPLPKRLSFAYVPLKIAHDFLMLPLWRAYGNVLAQAERLKDALARHDLVLAMMPASAEMRQKLKQHKEACADANRTLAANPNSPAAWYNLGNALFGLKRYKEAIACFDKALALAPDSQNVWNNRRAAMAALKKKDQPYIDESLALNPQDANAWAIRAGFLSASQRYTEAAEASERALSLDPEHLAAMRVGIRSRLYACDWRRREDDKRWITEKMKAGVRIITPLDHRSLSGSEEESLAVARLWAKEYLPSAKPLWRGERYRHDRIRVAYISADFRSHVVASVIVGCFEHHDKTRFETIAISVGSSDESEMRRRIETAFDRFIDVQGRDNAAIAAMLRELEIDIAVDLNGHTHGKRGEILAHRPAPLQVNYLGYPGTMAAPFIDYIIADHVVIPDEHQIHYSEKVVYLPHTYLPYDGKRRVAEKTPSRAEVGLPETGFVFASFNLILKIDPEMFDIWMRLLRAVEGSVLWLRSGAQAAERNLRREAEARGVAPERLVFAPRLPQAEDYLARLRVADLFLDTLPYNAHSTANDALRGGLPVLTCPGKTFPARVAASVLHAVGMPELIVSSLTEYEELALKLARDPERLAAIRAKLMRNRDTYPLFDTARFTRDLEAAYMTMWKRQQDGLAPASFSVPSQKTLRDPICGPLGLPA